MVEKAMVGVVECGFFLGIVDTVVVARDGGIELIERKPGALRNGAPFRDWVLPSALEKVRRKLQGADDGDRQMVDILAAVLTEGLPAVDAACAEVAELIQRFCGGTSRVDYLTADTPRISLAP